ncbi:DUF4197 domain-containing protein [Derxia gummosa]|uniref:DUF4197 domain-containing protein n=1 Tax=Derxia gummosa DSM 723 TaxID=1121388 RepID=A0A8B6X515_9BURK|nr:DUF4197 domain-containing protein [Derxia gummosa]
MNRFHARRRLLAAAPTLAVLGLPALPARAGALDALSSADASGGLRAALEQGIGAAVGRLGTTDGFLGNPKLRIHPPAVLEQARPLLALAGQGKALDDLDVAMNRAAEQAVPLAKPLLVGALRDMKVDDAKRILTGGDTSATDYFRAKTSDQLGARFLPIVKGVTDKSGLATQYNALAGKVAGAGLLDGPERSVETWVTSKALAALFTAIGDEEKAIRANPLQAGSKLAEKVFGALR